MKMFVLLSLLYIHTKQAGKYGMLAQSSAGWITTYPYPHLHSLGKIGLVKMFNPVSLTN